MSAEEVRAAYRVNPKPAYPRQALMRNWTGKVILRVHVAADGSVGSVSVQESSGHDILDEAAVDAVKTWRFNPAKRNGQPVAVWATVPITFRLQN